jgi:hypothetical protein
MASSANSRGVKPWLALGSTFPILSAEKARSRDCALPRAGDTVRWTRWDTRDKGRRSRLAHCGAQTGMNTTKLIAQWTMSGARRGADGRFRATDDIGAVIADNEPTPEPTTAASSFLIKGADEHSWQPLEGGKPRV